MAESKTAEGIVGIVVFVAVDMKQIANSQWVAQGVAIERENSSKVAARTGMEVGWKEVGWRQSTVDRDVQTCQVPLSGLTIKTCFPQRRKGLYGGQKTRMKRSDTYRIGLVGLLARLWKYHASAFSSTVIRNYGPGRSRGLVRQVLRIRQASVHQHQLLLAVRDMVGRRSLLEVHHLGRQRVSRRAITSNQNLVTNAFDFFYSNYLRLLIKLK